jgi:deoxyribodipyrimidine photo-lyase
MTGGRLNRFNTVKQSKDYDQHGDYVRHWIPELKDVPNQLVHEPWKMNQFEQMQYNVRLGVDYPNPIVPPFQPKPYERGEAGGDSNRGDGGNNRNKQRKPNKGGGNRHQKYEMKSLKEGRFELK